jgi:hypothetical protein
MLLYEGQSNDHVDDSLMYDARPCSKIQIADKGYHRDDFLKALEKCKKPACVPSRRTRRFLIVYDKPLYKTRHKIENISAQLEGWRNIASRHDYYFPHQSLVILYSRRLLHLPESTKNEPGMQKRLHNIFA